MVKKYFLSFFFIATLAAASTATVRAQTVIGMGTEQPNPNAVLELVPEQGNQGFLAPRLTTAQRQAASFTGKLSRADHGLLVFDTNEGQFYYWFNGAWRLGTSGGTGSPTSEISGTTWYAGTTAPSNVDAAEGDFYINESTGEVFRFSGNAFISVGSLAGTPASTPNLSSVLQQGGSAGNQKISDLNSPTDANDAATKSYVDTELANVSALNPNLKAVLDQDNNAEDSKITNLGDPTDDKDAATKKYVDDKLNNVTVIGSTPGLEDVLNEDRDANGKITKLAYPTDTQDAASKQYVDDRETATRTYVDQEIATLPPGGSTPSLEQVLAKDNKAKEKIIELTDPDNPQDAATKNYVDTNAKITKFAINGNLLEVEEGGNAYSVSVGGATPSLEQVLNKSNSAANKQIINLATPSADDHAVNRKYVDDRDLEDALDRDNSAGGNQITNVGTPTADHHAATRGYVNTTVGSITFPDDSDDQPLDDVLSQGNNAGDRKITGLEDPDDPQDAATKNYVDSEAKITEFSIDGDDIKITEGGNSISVSLPPATPATLNEGRLFVGNASDKPIPVTISGHITIDANGVATITNAMVTTAKIANGAVTKEKINADVAGPGLAKDTNVEGLRVNVGSGLIIDSDEVKISPFPEGWIGIGQGLGNDMDFKPVNGDATLAQDGKLIVQGLRGRTVASSAPSDKQVLQWDNGANEWAPASLPPAGGGGSQQWYAGNNQPNPGNPSGAQDGDYYLRTNSVGNEKIYRKVGGTWQELGGFTKTGVLNTNGTGYSYRTPWLYSGPDKPDDQPNNFGQLGDMYYDTNEQKMYFKVKNNEWKGL